MSPHPAPFEKLPRPGSFALLGLLLTLALTLLDLGVKHYLLTVFHLGERGLVPFLPGLDLVLSKNPGVSFGLFAQDSMAGRLFLVGFNAIVALAFIIWQVRTSSLLVILGAGFLSAGALGNAIDRLMTGAVTDYLFFHIGSFQWYVFNLADTWIFIGAFFILLDNIRATKKSA